MASASSFMSASSDTQQQMTYWESFQEWLLPAKAFRRSETPEKDIAYGRAIVCILYAVITMVFVYTGMRLCYSGRIELFSNLYKVDFIEAPSLAFCPFHANETIGWPNEKMHPLVSARKIDPHGSHDLKSVGFRNCSFDRKCACVDMDKYHLTDISRQEADDPVGSHGMVARENIEIRTNLTDPSGEHVLKVGIYDSYDKTPDWFYVDQGSMFIGQLELIVWTVVDVSIAGLVNTFKGDIRAMMKNRHIFRYTSQVVGDNRQFNHSTSVRYEMKTFFVEETMSSHRALSLYTVFMIVALVALRYVVVDAFFHFFLPEWVEKHSDHKTRELSPTSVWLRNLCFCCWPEADESENEPLIKHYTSSPQLSARSPQLSGRASA